MRADVLIIIILLCILLIPGLLFTEILAHELYHVFSHKEYAEEVCIDFNEPYRAHTVVRFDNRSMMLEYQNSRDYSEEEKAKKIGKLASMVYLIIFSVILFWFIHLMRKKC